MSKLATLTRPPVPFFAPAQPLVTALWEELRIVAAGGEPGPLGSQPTPPIFWHALGQITVNAVHAELRALLAERQSL
jgi:hypothetical protein